MSVTPVQPAQVATDRVPAIMIDVSTLPPVLTKQQAAALCQISPSTLMRRVNDGTIVSATLGTTVRIPRDPLLVQLGLVSGRSQRRQSRQAVHEAHQAAARFGLAVEGDEVAREDVTGDAA